MKKVLVLGCSEKQVEYLKILKKNYEIILLDKNINSPGKKHAMRYFQCSYTDKFKLNYLLKKKLIKADYIFTASSHFSYIGVEFLAHKLGIKNFPKKKSISKILNKTEFYTFLKNENINIPWTKRIFKKKDLIQYKNLKNIFFLKSDFGKSPYYIYKGEINTLLKKNIHWKKNNFLKKNYLLQKNFKGKEIRVNVFQKKCLCFYFKNGKKILKNDKKRFDDLKILKSLLLINKKLEIEKLLVKYDVIISDTGYVVIDIGLDPPQRMLNHFNRTQRNFYKFYLKFFIK